VSNPRRSDRQGGALAPFGGPVAILVDGLSVSTSEIFAAGLQVLGRARIFGEATAGQALPAMIAQLPNGDVMQYVVADFTAPDGRRIEARGVAPDHHRPLRRGALLAGRDEALADALAWAGTLPVTAAAATVWPSGVPRR
jgi:carboxyl-terminal processing protease